ncbi:MAG TPA: hypothetical protein VFZ78_10745 [Flavisolibacter sp.]
MKYYIIPTKYNMHDPAVVVQQAQEAGGFSCSKLVQVLQDMPAEDFETFCKEICRLQEFHDAHAGAWATDNIRCIPAGAEKFFWQLR